MTEEFLHFVWKFKMLSLPLFLQSGEEVHILRSGIHNHDAGPDFINAMIRIGKTRWAGNVEIHLNASDWFKHRHQNDQRYDNIILHVVYRNDREVKRKNNESIPTLELTRHIDESLLNRYLDIIGSTRRIPCQNMLKSVDSIIIRDMLEKVLVERLEQKSIFILNRLVQNKNNWEQSFYEHLAASFGLKVNAEAFEMLARSLPVHYLARHKDDLFQLEALLFGQAGFLNGSFKDSYPRQLKKEYRHLRNKFNLQPIPVHNWKFLRLRPSNFPGIRIAQFAALMHCSPGIFSEILETKEVDHFAGMFKLRASSYWDSHYRFEKKSSGRPRPKVLGENSRLVIMINTIVPFLFVYGKQKSDQRYCSRAINLLERTAPEENQLTRLWKESCMPVQSAFDSQALLQLFNQYCRNKKCIECKIGIKLLKA
ncbi:MAG: DUF2851 family protein [Bacteroidota bacterium]|nr:DUF2851 family protein [Bacteroidota bacterium]